MNIAPPPQLARLNTAVSLGVMGLALGSLTLFAQPAVSKPAIMAIEAESFQFTGDWDVADKREDSSGSGILFTPDKADLPAVTALAVPKAGAYTLWVRSMDFPDQNPGTRNFSVAVGARTNSTLFGRSGKAGWSWERGDVFQLAQGPVLLTVRDNQHRHYARVDALLFCDDPNYLPRGTLAAQKLPGIAPFPLSENGKNSAMATSPVTISPVTDASGANLAGLENENLRVRFIAATRDGKSSACPVVDIKTATGWATVPIDPSAESYQVISGPLAEAVKLTLGGFYPKWEGRRLAPLTVECGGVRIQTRPAPPNPRVIWSAGQNCEGIVRRVTQLGPNRVRLDFYPTAAGSLQAVWELRPGEKTARVEMTLTPFAAGQYSLGYFLFQRKPPAGVQELLLPMMVQRKRFPASDYTLLDAECPTPVSLMQTASENGSLTLGVSADPAFIPFKFPTPDESSCGLHIRSPQGLVQPSIYGPLINTKAAHAKAGEPVKFGFRVLVQPGDWYAGYRTAADEVFGWRDYRKNGAVSLTQAALNMIDLYLNDEFGGWWERAKAPCQIESRNGATQSSPLTAVSLYRLTGDPELYRRRTLPTLEFILSRDGAHFSPIPENTGSYPKGSMNGPVTMYGTTVYGGLWEMMNRRTPVFQDIALAKAIPQQNFAAHIQSFDDWLGRYLLTGEKTALDNAIRDADVYIQAAITTPPSAELGTPPFFLISYTPAWEGLLRLYEVTKEKRFLDAAEQGAHVVMTGMWTQPTPGTNDITIHPGGVCHGDLLDEAHMFYKGPEKFRLGWPFKAGDAPEKTVPDWLVSNVGLGFEQPSTYTYKGNGGRMIFQAPWTSAFLRLARYTGDRQFETYARNAVVGRWGNYPGYYITTFTDLMQNPRYPYVGPDMGFIYYHHINVHLSWTLDYLVSEAALRSAGAIHFPELRQLGYAYFDNLVYGHAPGEIFGEKDAWLWLRKDLVSLDNPQINYLTAHSRNKFFTILMNENREAETVTVTFPSAKISGMSGKFTKARILTGKGGELPLIGNAAQITVAPRGLVVLAVDGLEIDVPAHRIYPQPKPSDQPGFVKTTGEGGIEVRAAAIQIEPGPWQAYVWATAESHSLKEISLLWTIGTKTGTLKDLEYPYEFSVSVPAGETAFRFHTRGIKADGAKFSTAETTIGVGQ